jgi:hypothetical protein
MVWNTRKGLYMNKLEIKASLASLGILPNEKGFYRASDIKAA